MWATEYWTSPEQFRIMAVLASPATQAALRRPIIKSRLLRSILYRIGRAERRMHVVLAAPPGESDAAHTIAYQRRRVVRDTGPRRQRGARLPAERRGRRGLPAPHASGPKGEQPRVVDQVRTVVRPASAACRRARLSARIREQASPAFPASRTCRNGRRAGYGSCPAVAVLQCAASSPGSRFCGTCPYHLTGSGYSFLSGVRCQRFALGSGDRADSRSGCKVGWYAASEPRR